MEIPWVIPEQTKIKHQLLKNYIATWMAILFSQQENFGFPQRLIYLDGFSGPGIYYEDETKSSTCLGSPLLVAEIANKFLEAKPKREIAILCLDKHRECVDMLNSKLNEFNKYNQNWKAYSAEFDEAINSLIDAIEDKGVDMPPMFCFIDPFGYTGFPMTTLKRLLKYPLTELFINFMIYHIVRFCEEENRESQLEELFGCPDFKKVNKTSDSEEKQHYLVNLYCEQLRNTAGAKYVMPFRINTPEKGARPKYYLIHASNNKKALKVMKDNMAKVSETPYNFVAIGISPQESLFEDPDKVTLRQRIREYCDNNYPSELDYTEVEEWAYANTNGYSKTIKQALIDLETAEIISIKRKPRQRKNTVTEGAIIACTGGKK